MVGMSLALIFLVKMACLISAAGNEKVMLTKVESDAWNDNTLEPALPKMDPQSHRVKTTNTDVIQLLSFHGTVSSPVWYV